MSPETVQKHLLQQPFQPFRVCLSDGATYEVRQPEMVLVLQREVIIALPKPGEQFPRHIGLLRPVAHHPDRTDQRPRRGSAVENSPLIDAGQRNELFR